MVLTKKERLELARKEYEADVAKRPTYHEGTPRKTFDELPELYQLTWAPKFNRAA